MTQNEKCLRCVGHGIWAIGDPSPMGEMDSNSMPSKKCPECGSIGKCPVDEK